MPAVSLLAGPFSPVVPPSTVPQTVPHVCPTAPAVPHACATTVLTPSVINLTPTVGFPPCPAPTASTGVISSPHLASSSLSFGSSIVDLQPYSLPPAPSNNHLMTTKSKFGFSHTQPHLLSTIITSDRIKPSSYQTAALSKAWSQAMLGEF